MLRSDILHFTFYREIYRFLALERKLAESVKILSSTISTFAPC